MYTCKLAPHQVAYGPACGWGRGYKPRASKSHSRQQQPQLGWGTGRARPKKAGRWKCGALGMLENGMGCVNRP